MWPPPSPDINPYHFAIWSILESDVSAKSYSSVAALKDALLASWSVLVELVRHYKGYTRELSGKGVRPFPPTILGAAHSSRDHSPEIYREVILPMFAAMDPPPKVSWVPFGAGVHSYSRAEPDLPLGIAPAVAQLWYDAIMGGYYEEE